jgi:hypothetical protein
VTKKKEPKEWVMPEWMEKYRPFICNTGGNPVEELVNDHDSNVQNNWIRTALIVGVKSQVGLLITLHEKGLA